MIILDLEAVPLRLGAESGLASVFKKEIRYGLMEVELCVLCSRGKFLYGRKAEMWRARVQNHNYAPEVKSLLTPGFIPAQVTVMASDDALTLLVILGLIYG